MKLRIAAATVLISLSSQARGGGPDVVVGSFDPARGGNSSLNPMSSLADAIQAEVTATFLHSDELTEAFLSQLDVIILSSPFNGSTQITPLSSSEQANLLNFVLDGGGVVIATDNQGFHAANSSLLAPFGMASAIGILSAVQPATVTDGSTSVTAGVCAFEGNFAGWFTGLGPATELATWDANGQPALALIEHDELGPGSGRVVLTSDACVVQCGGLLNSGTMPLQMLRAAVPQWDDLPLCTTDVDDSGETDIDDVVAVILAWGMCDCCPEDVNSDGLVDIDDVVQVILNWGPC